MNTRTLASAVLLALGAAAAAPAVFAADAVVVTKHHYVYYGDHQIYFAPDTKTYYWQKEGRWESGALPAEDQAYIKTGGVNIDLDTDRPYERHDWVVKHYRDKHDGDHDNDHDHGH